MKRTECRFHAALKSSQAQSDSAGVGASVGMITAAPIIHCKIARHHGKPRKLDHGKSLILAALNSSIIGLALTLAMSAKAETRPHYGGTLRVMMQFSPAKLELSPSGTPAEYWEISRVLSLIGDTLVKMDAQGRAQPSLAITWSSNPTGTAWRFALRQGVKFQDGTAVTAASITQILSSTHKDWAIHATVDSISIEREVSAPSLLAELALPRNTVLKRSATGVPIGTGPFLVTQWQPGKLLNLAAYEESWAGRPFLNGIEIKFGKPLRDQFVALQRGQTDLIETAPASSPDHDTFSSFPLELMALIFPANSNARDPRLREALALAIDRKPIQSVLLRDAGEPAATILPNWMTGYTAVFPSQANLQRARSLLADSRQPVFHLSYDPREPETQLIADRIALNASEVGITLQVSLSGADDIRLVRAVLPSPDAATSLAEAARSLELPPPAFTPSRETSLDELYVAERNLLAGYNVIPLFHLPLATTVGPTVLGFEPDHLDNWNAAGSSLADAWLVQAGAVDLKTAGSP